MKVGNLLAVHLRGTQSAVECGYNQSPKQEIAFRKSRMPIEYTIDNELGVLVVYAVGTITIRDRADIVHRLLCDHSLPDVIPVLIDVAEVTNIPEGDDIWKMAFLAEQIGERFRSKVAYFVVKPGMVTPYQLVAMSVHQHRIEVSTFANRSQAIRWLGGKQLGEVCHG